MVFSWPDTAQLRRHLPRGRELLAIVAGVGIILAAIGIGTMTNREVEPPTKPLAAAQGSVVDIGWLPETVRRWDGQINAMAHKYDIGPNVLAILMTLESGGYTRAQSEADAQGLLQVTPPTAQDISTKFLQEPRAQYDLFDPATNVEFGAAYLAHLRDEFGDPGQGPSWDYTVELIAAGYNGGPGAAGRLFRGEGLGSEAASYSRDALNMWRERRAQTSPTFNRWLERGGQRLIDRAREEQATGINR